MKLRGGGGGGGAEEEQQEEGQREGGADAEQKVKKQGASQPRFVERGRACGGAGSKEQGERTWRVVGCCLALVAWISWTACCGGCTVSGPPRGAFVVWCCCAARRRGRGRGR